MTPRTIRRAAERKANKLARKSAQQLAAPQLLSLEATEVESPCEVAEIFAPIIVPSTAANAHLSAIASPLTGQAALLPMADAAQYGGLLRDHQLQYQPVGLQESNLVQSLAEIVWRMRRMVALEMSIFAKGRIEFAKQFAEHNPDLRESLIDLHTFLTYEKQIRALQLQEARLSRRADKQTAELQSLQKERKEREKLEQRQSEPSARPQNGSVFSNHEISVPAGSVSGPDAWSLTDLPASLL